MTGPVTSLRVLLVEDHDLLAQSVGLALESEGHHVLVSALTSVGGILQEARQLEPHVVLLDLDLGGGVGDGLGLIAPLRQLGTRVLVVTGTTEDHRLGLCLEQGAAGVLAKRASLDRLLRGLVLVAEGGSPTDQARRQSLLSAVRAWRAADAKRLEPFQRLTSRERQVLGHLVEGRSADAIARGRFVSEATVRTQIRGVLTKLGVTSQLAAVAAARAAGWAPEQ